MDWFPEKTSLNEVQLRNIICKWSSKSMIKLKVQNLWNDLNDSYSPNIFLAHSIRIVGSCPSINFCFEFIWDSLSAVTNSKISFSFYSIIVSSIIRSFHKMEDTIHQYRRHPSFRFKYPSWCTLTDLSLASNSSNVWSWESA